ncbi:hypothetical protein LTR62_004681 [Meristemomyces frigidus]|uniref:F-box domain-containing protein n=1 Tax=Meristemomyces frigidus TaxID=1508187 RepID=A0AAN7TF86_9PEZI|nr:hypothetical protein LTR62_004681 [Meristemomyces frigidus]
MTQSTGLLDLPTELLDNVYHYLDWDRTVALIPVRPSIREISLTCKSLRNSILPRLFRSVSLCLRWVDGHLLEPELYRLRRDRPDLARHVRCVCITIKLRGQPGAQNGASTFQVPLEREDWLDLEAQSPSDAKHAAGLASMHTQRVDKEVQQLCDEVSAVMRAMPATSSTSASTPPDEAFAANAIQLLNEPARRHRTTEARMYTLLDLTSKIVRRKAARLESTSSLNHGEALTRNETEPEFDSNFALFDDGEHPTSLGAGVSSMHDYSYYRDKYAFASYTERAEERMKLKVDSLAVIMLCLPATTTELVFEAGVQALEHKSWYHFGLYFMNTAMGVFGPKLHSITTAVGTPTRRLRPRTTSISEPDSGTIFPDSPSKTTSLRRLVIASTTDHDETYIARQFTVDESQFDPWTNPITASSLFQLELWCTSISDTAMPRLVTFVKGFTSLKILRLKHLTYSTHGAQARIMPNPNTTAITNPEPVMLQLAIDLRRAIPATTMIELDDIGMNSHGQRREMPVSALRWIMNEAVPPGAVIDFQREERLFEDFESFLMLWRAEDSPERGSEAEQASMKAKLVDAALCSRWKSYENVRRDNGTFHTL